MLITIPTKHAAGITLWGDYNDLHDLHDTIHALAENSPHNQGIKDTMLGLAYDVRHAYQGDREERQFGFAEHDRVNYRGVKILWPVVLFQMSALRSSAAFQPTTKGQQATLYRLEQSLEESLNQVDAGIASRCIGFLNSPLFLTQDYYCLFVGLMANRYVEGPGGKRRFRKLPAILQSFHPTSEEYKTFAAHLEATAKEKNCSPHALEDAAEGPDFQW